MIGYIKGYITDKDTGKIVIENNGIGYEVFVPDNCSLYLSSPDEQVIVYTFMAVREDDISLFGFTDKESLKMFKLLTTVSGIGNKGAMSILSKLSVRELRQAIVFGDDASIAKANGIGKKTAAKLVLELRDKIGDVNVAEGIEISSADIKTNSAKDEAVMALTSLGFSKSEAMAALIGVADDGLKAEDYVRIALRLRR